MRNIIRRAEAVRHLFVVALLALLLLPVDVPARMAERMADPVGKTDSYFSDNGVWEVAITYGNLFHSWSMKKNGQELWNHPLMGEPGGAAVSDNGELITLPLWGWRDEGGSSGIAVYNGQGEPVREIMFRNADGSESLRWVRRIAIAPEGSCIAIGENRREAALVTMFDVTSGNIVWETNAGLPEIDDVRVSAKGEYTLAATSKYGTGNMEFLLFDKHGTAIWSEKRSGNLSWDVKMYVRFLADGKGFEIYDLKSKSWMKRRFSAQKH